MKNRRSANVALAVLASLVVVFKSESLLSGEGCGLSVMTNRVHSGNVTLEGNTWEQAD